MSRLLFTDSLQMQLCTYCNRKYASALFTSETPGGDGINSHRIAVGIAGLRLDGDFTVNFEEINR